MDSRSTATEDSLSVSSENVGNGIALAIKKGRVRRKQRINDRFSKSIGLDSHWAQQTLLELVQRIEKEIEHGASSITVLNLIPHIHYLCLSEDEEIDSNSLLRDAKLVYDLLEQLGLSPRLRKSNNRFEIYLDLFDIGEVAA